MDIEIKNVYKDFIYGIRKIEWDTPFLIIVHQYPPKYLEDYVKMIQEVIYEDDKCNAYYGEIKKIVFSFFNFYTACISQTNEQIERYLYRLTYAEMMELISNTLIINDDRFSAFKKDYDPIDSLSEELMYNESLSRYQTFRQQLVDFGNQLYRLKKHNKIVDFAKNHLPLCIEKTAAMCDYAHVFISKMLFARILWLRTSIRDMVHRIRLNTLDFNESYEVKLNALYNEMYDLNKERLSISRRLHRSSTDTAEIETKINMVRDKIEKFGNFEIMNRLKAETEYWTKKLEEFDYISSIIMKIKDPLDRMTKEEQIFNKYNAIEMHGSKATCWDVIGENYALMKEDLEAKFTRACRSLITFFVCRGTDRILYTDEVGSYYVDEYGHQNYITNYGAKFFHVKCDGEFIENLENDKYFFDSNGRYIVEDGQKLYQLAPCTNKYVRNEEGLLHLYTTCHCRLRCSQNEFVYCGYDIKDLSDYVILPTVKPMDIRQTLDSATVWYLWQSLGWILPEVLYEVGTANSKNPIHYFAHALLNKKYAITEKKTLEMKRASVKYGNDIFLGRIEAAAAAHKAWKNKLAKPCKPEDLDNKDQELAVIAHQAEQQLITDINQYYNY